MSKNYRAQRIEECWQAYTALIKAEMTTTELTVTQASIEHELQHCGTSLHEEIKRHLGKPMMTVVAKAESRRALARAAKVIRPGDRVTVRQCAGTTKTFIFDSFTTGGLSSKGFDEFSAGDILAVNGKSVSFFDWAVKP